MNDGITHALSKEQILVEKICALYSKLEDLHKKIKDNNTPSGSDPDARKLYIVTRKLPFQLVKRERGWKVETSGAEILDDMLMNCASVHAQPNSIWIGSAGADVEPWEQSSIRQKLLKQHRYYTVFIDQHKETLFYEGFCKSTLWPLFHTSPPTTDDVMDAHDPYDDNYDGDDEKWQSYVSVNRMFAETLQDMLKDEDMVWIHGYELMLVPQMLRSLIPHARIGFYLHIPFPTAELYRVLAHRELLLEGILDADLIGFQTYQYARHFFSSCESVLGLECSSKGVDYVGHFASVCITSVGINPERFETMAKSAGVRAIIDRWSHKLKGRRMLLGIDKLESTMGLIHKLLAIEDLFADNDKLPRQVVFVQVLLPSKRLRREQHQLESQLHSMAIRINSHLNALDVEGPIQFLSQNITVEEVVALYCMAETLVITPLRDGMNVRPFEYVVCRHALGTHAAVVLSEFAGCARSLGGALLVNPWDTNQVKETILKAMQLDFQDRIRAHDNMVQYVYNFTSSLWKNTFIEQLRDGAGEVQRTTARELHVDHVLQAYQESTSRLLLLGLEGVLCDRYSLAELISIRPEVIQFIRRLAVNPQNAVVIKSSRARSVLDTLFQTCLIEDSEDDWDHDNMTLILAAEDGLFVRNIGDNEWYPTYEMSAVESSDWREHVSELLEHFTERTPGSVIETKDMGIAWHYRDSDVVHGAWQARQVQVSLMELGKRIPITVFFGDRVVEIRPRWTTYAATNILQWLIDHMDQDEASRPFQSAPIRAPNSTISAMTSPVNSLVETRRKQRAFSFAYGDVPNQDSSRFKEANGSQPVASGSGKRKEQDLDFIFILVSGTDSNDEDIFEAVAPRPFDLEEIIAQRDSIEESEFVDKTDNLEQKLTLEIEPALAISTAFHHTNTNATHPNASPVVPPQRLNILSTVPEAKASRRMDIKERGLFAPRRDFPPAALLFKAMKKKFGENWSRDELPDTPAACWSLVMSMQDDTTNTTFNQGRAIRSHAPSTVDTDQEFTSFAVAHTQHSARGKSAELDFMMGRTLSDPDIKYQRASQLYKEPFDGPGYAAPLARARSHTNSTTSPPGGLASSPASDSGFTSAMEQQTPDIASSPKHLDEAGLHRQSSTDVDQFMSFETLPALPQVNFANSVAMETDSAASLPINTFSCAVGIRISQALHYLKNRQAAISLVRNLAEMIIVKIDNAFSTRLHLSGSSSGLVGSNNM